MSKDELTDINQSKQSIYSDNAEPIPVNIQCRSYQGPTPVEHLTELMNAWEAAQI